MQRARMRQAETQFRITFTTEYFTNVSVGQQLDTFLPLRERSQTN